METTSDLRLVSLVGDFDKNLEIAITGTNLELRIGKKYLFNTLKERKTIVALINKKLDELVEEQIRGLAIKENERNGDL